MRLYKSDGKVFVKFNETIELGEASIYGNFQEYKNMLLKRVSERFDRAVAEAALRGMDAEKQ